MFLNRFVVVLFLLGLLLSCGSQENSQLPVAEPEKAQAALPDTYTKEVREGVTFIHNTGSLWENAAGPGLELIRVLGRADSPGPELVFYKPSDLALDGSGNLYLVDSGNHRILKFAPDGTQLASYGREGQGPGEFQFMEGIALDSTGRMYISDKATNNVKILNPQGDQVDSLPPGGPSGRLSRLSTGALLCLDTSRNSQALVARHDQQGSVDQRYGERERHEDFDSSRFFNRVFFSHDTENHVYIAYATRNKVEKYSPDGRLLLCFDRPVNFPESQEIAYEKHQFGAREIPIPFVNFFSADISLDDQNRIWILSYSRQLKFEEMGLSIHYRDGDGRYEGNETIHASENIEIDAFEFHIFDPKGRLLKRIPLTRHSGVVRIFRDRLYLLEPRHSMCVYCYRITSS
jgi:hypothetical protein